MRKFVSAVACTALLSLAVSGCAMDPGEEDDASLDNIESYGAPMLPIIFVPGCPPPGMDYPTIATAFNPMVNYLLSKGYPSNYLDQWIPNTGLPVCYASYDLAARLSTEVQRVRSATGQWKVDIIAISGGAATARVYVGPLGGTRYVRNLVTLAGTNHGSQFASIAGDLQAQLGYPNYEQMKEMYPPYACQGQTWGGQSRDVQFDLNGCLTKNTRTVWRDETPGYTDYLSVWNTLDDQIIPTQSACLNQRRQNDCSDSEVNDAFSIPGGYCDFPPAGNQCPPHFMIAFDANVWADVYSFLRD